MRVFKKILSATVYTASVAAVTVFTIINSLPALRQLAYSGISHIVGGIVLLLAGALAAGFIGVLLHELAHFAAGRFNGFKAVSFRVLGREFVRSARGKLTVNTQMHGPRGQQFFDEGDVSDTTAAMSARQRRRRARFERAAEAARQNSGEFSYGSCDLISVREGSYRKRLLIVTLAGIIMSFILFVFAALYALIWSVGASGLLAAFLLSVPLISAHFFLSFSLPSETDGRKNDGAVAAGLITKSDSATVMLALLGIQTQLYLGNTPSQIDRRLYFELPAVADGTAESVQLHFYRYFYYLDREDFKEAAQQNMRLSESLENMRFGDSTKFYLNVLFDTVYAKESGKARALYELAARDADFSDITDMRIIWYYHKSVGDKQREEKFYQLAKSGSSALDGIYKMENRLMETLAANEQ